MGKIRLVGDYSSKIYTFAEESANVLKIKNASDGLDYLTIDNVTVTDASGVKLASHSSRHDRGGADPLDYSLIAKLLLKSVSPTLGTGGALGSAVSITPDSGFTRIVPLGIKIDVGGTFASGETVTVRITFVFDDGTNLYVDKSFTATGTTYLTDADFFSLWKNGVGITRINVQAGSSASTTSVTVTVTVRGVQH
jgi:hypothetical protein